MSSDFFPSTATSFTAGSVLRDNRPSRGTAGQFLAETITSGSLLSFASAYFTVHAYDKLREPLHSAKSLRFLFGEPSFVSQIDKDKAPSKNFKLTHGTLTLEDSLKQRQLARDCAAWIREKVEIRSIIRTGFMHGKMYHIDQGGSSHALVGSSNFTVPGLGLKKSGSNIELNIVVDSKRDTADVLAWFDELWNDRTLVEDVKKTVLQHLERLYGNQPPQFIYYLTLFHVFRSFLEADRDSRLQLDKTSLYDSLIWKKLFTFQKDGVRGAIRRLLDYNGCILADSVGLGKTFEALAVIKYFLLRNERILVICPKKLWQNWHVWKSPSRLNSLTEDKFHYDLVAHTDLSRLWGKNDDGIDLKTINWGNYDLVVIDESHNFRNNAVGTADQDGKKRITRYERLMSEVVKQGIRSKVLLLSATPVNNQIADLRNQISFIAGGDVGRPTDEANAGADAVFAKTLGIPSIRETCRKAQAEFTLWTKLPPAARSTKDLLLRLGGDLFKLLDALSIARSRKQIERHYKAEMAHLGGFPKRLPPLSEYPVIDTLGKFPSFHQLDADISQLRLSLYHPSANLREDLPPETQAHYERKIGNFDQKGRERILISMMKVNFLKRLESSIDSFRLTLERTVAKIDKLHQRMVDFEAHRDANPEVDFDLIDPGEVDDGETDPEEFRIGGRHRIHLAHINIPKWRKSLSHDRAELQSLLDRAKPVNTTRDAKLQRLKAILEQRFTHPDINRDGEPIRKVIIFTAFADTARYLHENLAKWAMETHQVHSALISGGGENRTSLGHTEFDEILTNFAPRAKGRDKLPELPQDAEIDLLIATDCISEGQNLQDANLLVNFDIHWNPVRIIQRFGRIDRIGSRHDHVSLINFWPTADLDEYLGVKHRVEARMALVDLTASGEDNLLNTEQIEDLITNDLLYRNKQLKRLQNEVLDMEDLNEDGITLADFSLDDFRLDLLQFLEANREALENAPPGLYATVPPDPQIVKCQPGVLFCLRQRGQEQGRAADQSQINPLRPHFLLYVLDSGDVRFSFAQSKSVLQLFRDLAAGSEKADEALCDLFDHRTDHGNDMSHYSDLTRKALASIRRTFERRAAASLLSSRAGLLPTAAEIPAEEDDEFELLTWLVILNPKS